MSNKILIGTGIFVLVVVALLFIKPNLTGNVVENGLVKIPLSEISEKASFYEQDGIAYFAVKAADGSVKTAFDACDVCYYSGKGYRQEGNYMVCNNCGNKYPIAGLGTENIAGGGCWPGYLPSRVDTLEGTSGEYLIIKTSDIEKGGYRF
ncbi:DUF2318 domain-containing protein [Candidatus Pacearchaeota archaeon]|nr:DUF2318 domain-containing protein [Candidatus Pacearchaeota archaeon]